MVSLYKSIARSYLHIFAVLLFSVAVVFNYFSPVKPVNIDRQLHSLSPKASIVRYLNLGNHRSIASLLWVHTLMESDLTHYTQPDLKSWIYVRLNEITVFDPKFWEAYYYGAEYLMVIKNDIAGAEALLTKGLKVFPLNFGLNYKMGYLMAIEKRDPKSAFLYFNRVKNSPERPVFFDSLISKLAYSSLSLADARKLVENNLKLHTPSSPVYQRLHYQAYTLKALEDLSCLNSKKPKCNLTDFDGESYIYKEGQWISKRKLLKMNLSFK